MTSMSTQGTVFATVLTAAAIVSLICAAALMVFAPHILVYRAAAMTCVAIGVALSARAKRSFTPRAKLTRYQRVVSSVLALATVCAYRWLYLDAVAGYHQVMPVYAFAAAGLVSAVWFGGVASRMIGREQ